MKQATSTRALITGASGGIGYELAKLFAQDGTSLILVARQEDKLRAKMLSFGAGLMPSRRRRLAIATRVSRPTTR